MSFIKKIHLTFAPHSENANLKYKITNLRQVGLFCFATSKTEMKEVILKIDDSVYEKFMGLVSLCPQVEVVRVDEAAVVQEGRMADRVRHAIIQLRAEKLLLRKYDYAWLMVAMNSLDDMPTFGSAQSYLNYLKDDLQLGDLPSESTISKKMDLALGTIFNWTFCDTVDKHEMIRRNNIVKRFFNLVRTRT